MESNESTKDLGRWALAIGLLVAAIIAFSQTTLVAIYIGAGCLIVDGCLVWYWNRQFTKIDEKLDSER